MQTKSKEAPLLKGAQLVYNAELIRVKTISPKIVEQLPFIDGSQYAAESTPVVLSEFEIVGKQPEGHAIIVQRLSDGAVYRLRCLAYLMNLHSLGMSREDAQSQYDTLPQIFVA